MLQTPPISLRSRGPAFRVPTLEALLTAREAALRTDTDSRVVAAQTGIFGTDGAATCDRARAPGTMPALPYRGFVPYGDWGIRALGGRLLSWLVAPFPGRALVAAICME